MRRDKGCAPGRLLANAAIFYTAPHTHEELTTHSRYLIAIEGHPRGILGLTQKSAEPYTLARDFARSSREKWGDGTKAAVRRTGLLTWGCIHYRPPSQEKARAEGKGRDAGLQEDTSARDDAGARGDGQGGSPRDAGGPRRDARERDLRGDPAAHERRRAG